MKTWQDIKNERDKNTNSVSTKWQDIVAKRGGTQKFSDYNNDSTENSRVLPKPNKEVKKIVPKVLKKNDTLTTQAQRTGVNGRPLPFFDANKLDKASGVASAVTQNALDSATLGLSTKGLDLITNNGATKSLNEAKKENQIASTVGNLAGYAVPFAGASKIVGAGGKVLVKAGAKPITNKLLKTAVVGATEGAIVGGTENGINGENVINGAKNMALFGAGGNLVVAGAGKLIGKVLKPRVFEKIEPKTETPKAEVPKVKGKAQTTLSGSKFKVNNPQYEKAVTKYNDAIETIQNNYGHFQLTPEETLDVLRNSKQKFGFDFKGILKDMSKYENKLNLKEISNRQNQKYVYGVENRITPKLKVPSKSVEQPNILGQATTPIGSEVNGTNATETNTPKIVTGTKADKTTIGQKINNAYTSIVNKNQSISNFSKLAGDKTNILATNSANQKNIADYILKDNLVDRKGNVIGDSFAKVIKDIPKNEENDFMMYALEKHNIARSAEGKPVLPNHDSVQSSVEVKKIESQHPEWKAKSENITGWINKFMNEWGVNAGTLDKRLHEANMKTYSSYIPTNRDFSTLEQGGESFGGGNKGFVNQTIPIKRATGSGRDIIDPRENIANMVVRTVKSAKNNEVGQSLAETVRTNPSKMSKFAEIVDEPKGNVSNVVRVLENGKPTYVKINDLGLLKAMEDLNKTDVGSIEAKAKTVTNAFKSLITQKNPVFAIRNIARDIPTAYINGSVNNPLKFSANLLSAGKDVLTNSENYQRYKALGGGGSNFFDSSNPTKSIKELVGNQNVLLKGLKAIPKGIEKFNTITESAPRLAEFKAVLKKTGDVDKALYSAGEVTTNFSRGGNTTKHVDSFVPYLNAGVQGLDKEARQLIKHPIATIAKGAAAITTPTLIINHINKDNPNYQALDNRTKDTYFLFPNPSDGGKTFIKIPKSRELGVLFGSLAERTQRAMNGESNAFKGFGSTIATNFSPSNPVENNIASPLIYNIPTNKDFAGRAIVPRWMKDQNLSPRYQYDEKTTELAKKLGDIANISPKQIDYIIKSYTGVLAQLGQPMNTKGGKPLDAITSQFKADPLYSNQATTDFYDNLNKLKQNAADKNFVENIPSKRITKEEIIRSKFTKTQTKISALNKKIKNTTDQSEIKSLRQAILDLEEKSNNMLK